MAANTPSRYRNLVFYEIYVRNHGPNGTFATLLIFWHGLLLFITIRMGLYLNVL